MPDTNLHQNSGFNNHGTTNNGFTQYSTEPRREADPTIFLAPRQSAMNQGKCFDILDYISYCNFEESEQEMERGSRLVFKAAPKKPKLESVSIWQWSCSSIRIQDELMKCGSLNELNVRNYMAYMCKILELNARFDWISILHYDREYRMYQSMYGFPWGTDIPHLTTCFLKEKDSRFNSNVNQNQNLPKSNFKRVERSKPKRNGEGYNCRDFNYKGKCSFNPCMYKHICDVPGCGQNHPAISHSNTKNE